MTLNREELARQYNTSVKTVDKYITRYVKDRENCTWEEFKQVVAPLKEAFEKKVYDKLVANATNDLETNKEVNFVENSSSAKERLKIMREQYNYTLKLYEQCKMKVNMTMLDDNIDENLKSMYQKNYREIAKTMMSYDSKVKELEKDLILSGQAEDNPFDD